MYRWNDKEKAWQERGVGNVMFVQNNDDKKIRVVHVQEQTFKVRALFYIFGNKACTLQLLQTSKNSYFWQCLDYSDGKPEQTKFAIRFKTEDEFKKFKELWESSKESNNKLMSLEKSEDKKPEENKAEEKTENKEAEKTETKEAEKTEQKEEVVKKED